MHKQSLTGVLNINKPAGPTSHDIVAEIRKLLTAKHPSKIRVGHTGTLDPFASGVLIVAIGSATRLIEYTKDWNKEYVAHIKLGATSDTDDITGNITPGAQAKPTRQQVQSAVQSHIGTIRQIPPRYAAIKIGGKKMYELARAGKSIEVRARTIIIHNITVSAYAYPDLTLAISCGPGTYIRALARDIGNVLKTGAYIASLCRTSNGTLNEQNAVKMQNLTTDVMQKNLLPSDILVATLPKIALTEPNVAKFRNGQQVEQGTIPTTHTTHAIYDTHNNLIGTGIFDPANRLLKPKKVLPS